MAKVNSVYANIVGSTYENYAHLERVYQDGNKLYIDLKYRVLVKHGLREPNDEEIPSNSDWRTHSVRIDSDIKTFALIKLIDDYGPGCMGIFDSKDKYYLIYTNNSGKRFKKLIDDDWAITLISGANLLWRTEEVKL